MKILEALELIVFVGVISFVVGYMFVLGAGLGGVTCGCLV